MAGHERLGNVFYLYFQLYWIAPPKGSGCIALKASVLVSEDHWYSENGLLTNVLCEETSADENVEPQRLRKCCACSEAKYEVKINNTYSTSVLIGC